MQGILFELYTSFKETRGYAVSAIALGITILAFYIGPQGSVPWKWLILVGSLLAMAFIVLTDFAIRSFKGATGRLPSVKIAKQPPNLYKNAVALLLLEKSVLFGHDALVSIYYQDDDLESLIGVGFVITIQRNGLIQVLVTHNFDTANGTIWKSVQENNATFLKRLLVKPSVPKQINSTGA